LRSTRLKEQWKAEVNAAWDRHSLGPYREAAEKVDIGQTVLYDMRKYGRIPSESTIEKWADGLGEPRDYWLRLAGFLPDAEALILRETRAPYITEDLLARLDDIQEKYSIPDEDMAEFREIIEKSKGS